MSHLPEVLIGVIEIQTVVRLWKAVFSRIPDPDGSIGNDQHLLGLTQSAINGLAVELTHEGLDPESSRRIPTLADDRPPPVGLPPMIETEHCAHIHPVPP